MSGTPGTALVPVGGRGGVRRVLQPTDLRAYQWKAIRFLQGHEHSALFLDMGLGKTISVLTFIKSLLMLKEAGVRTWLGVAPLRVVHGVWMQEAKKWTHTQDIKFSIVHGNEKKRRKALEEPAHVYLINPEGLMWLMELLKRLKLMEPGKWPFDGLFIDESSMFKSSTTKRWRALAKVLHLFKRRIILTGTPTPNSLLEIWPQIYMLDMGERLGSTFTRFRERFFIREEFSVVGGHTITTRWGLRQGSDQYMNHLLRDLVLRLDASDWLELPPVIGLEDQMGGPGDLVVDLPEEVQEMYKRFEDEMFLELETIEVEGLNAAALTQKCHQIANGAIYGTSVEHGGKDWTPLHDAKLDALQEIVDECGDNLLVAYQFQHDYARLKAKFPHFAPVAEMDIKQFEREWNDGKWPGALVHPKSMGHGLNLQDGGHSLAFFSLTWSKEQIDQVVARIGATRQAQAGRASTPIRLYRIITRNTVDEAIVASNAMKGNTQRVFLNALREYRSRHGQR